MVRNSLVLMFLVLLLVPASRAQQVLLLDDIANIVVYGPYEDDRMGWSMEPLGDVNGDGYDDLSTITNGPSIVDWSAFLVQGGSALPATIDLREASMEAGIFLSAFSRIGSVSDFNGDGINEFAVARVGYDLDQVFDVGLAFIGYGTETLPPVIELSEINAPGIKMVGHRPSEWVGNRIRTAGDFNGDGFDDVMIQGWQNRSSNIMEVIILFGGRELPQELSTENLDEHGIIITSAFSLDKLGDSLASVGDVNGDGLDDILIGADANPPGEDRAYLVYGSTDFPSLLNIGEIGARGVIITGSGEQFGMDVSGLGDINLDGYDDFMVAAPGRDSRGLNNSGAIQIIFGATDLPQLLDTEDLADHGITIEGTREDMILGIALSGRADLNGDIYPDFVSRPSTYEDDIYVFPGGPKYSKPGHISVDDLEFFVIHNPGGGLNYPNVMRFGDINGDGYDDILIGHEFASMPLPGGGKRDACGAVYVVFGGPERFPSMAQRCDLNDDGEVNHKDLFLFQSQWMKESD